MQEGLGFQPNTDIASSDVTRPSRSAQLKSQPSDVPLSSIYLHEWRRTNSSAVSRFELLYVRETRYVSKRQKCHSHEWATFLACNESAVANHRVAVLMEQVMNVPAARCTNKRTAPL